MKAQLGARVDLVDVLTAGAAAADKGKVEAVWRDAHVVGDGPIIVVIVVGVVKLRLRGLLRLRILGGEEEEERLGWDRCCRCCSEQHHPARMCRSRGLWMAPRSRGRGRTVKRRSAADRDSNMAVVRVVVQTRG